MNFLKNIFKKPEEPVRSYQEFWEWFQKNEKKFYKVVKENGDIEGVFFNALSTRLSELKEGFYYLTGMLDDHNAELVLTADGDIRNIVFVEELVKAAPKMDGWVFTALKPALKISDVNIRMDGYDFKAENISFYSNVDESYPDEIDISIIHNDLNNENRQIITNGVYIFLDNLLGELNFVTTIDNITVISKTDAEQELVPIEKLKDFLIWRQKEFIEKYEDVSYNTENDSYSMLEGRKENGNVLLATINRSLLDWEGKASHPWILSVEINYDGSANNGLPDNQTYALLNNIEDDILLELKDIDGYLNIGRQTADNVKEIYFACKEFRRPSTVVYHIIQKYSHQFKIDYSIYKDKYWQSFDRFITR